MEQIEKASRGLFVFSMFAVLLVLTAYGLAKYLEVPSLFIEPESNKSRTTLNMVLDSQNLEGLKKVCSLWASQNDRSDMALDALVDRSNELQRNGFVFILYISLAFAAGAGYLNLQVRRIRKASQNAL